MNHSEALQEAKRIKDLELRPYNRTLPPCTQRLWPEFDKYLSGRGLSFKLAMANFWFPSDQAGDNVPRVVIPATATPPNIFWQARAMDDNPKRHLAPLDGERREPRYQSCHGPKGDALCIVWPHDVALQGFVLFEGPMDALAAAELGYVGVATMGLPTKPGMEHLASMCLGAYKAPRIVVLDSDYAKPMLQAAGLLLELGVRMKVLDPSPAKDFAELDRVHRLRLLEG